MDEGIRILLKRSLGGDCKAQYYLYLPIIINTQRIDFDKNGRLITISQNPSLSITSSIIHQANNIIRWNQCIFLKCADSSLSFQIPPNISLPFSLSYVKFSSFFLPTKKLPSRFVN